jgi:outer membrane protein OmpA-like peptidoglycan-associated protein
LTDGQELIYFTSDRVSGKGGKDIWYAYKDENGGFGRAKNIGSPINTKYDEVSPFYHNATNTMYFSTDGKASLGGLDVFKSVLSDEEWLSPENLETPINSSLDDYDFILNDNGTFGFLVSNREGTTTVKSSTCCDDVFEVNITQFNLFLKGLVYAENKDGRELMKNAKVSLRDITSGKIEVLAYNGKLFSALLEKESDYELTASSDDFESVISTFTTKGLLKTDTLHYDLFFNEKRNFDNKIVGVIYYEYNQARLTAEAPKTLEQVLSFLNAHPNMTVEVSAHTDGNGSASYNLNLSKERCEAASNYLNFNGISKDRLVKKWFGESQLKASELNEDGTDNREGRSLNRRTEFKVVEITN